MTEEKERLLTRREAAEYLSSRGIRTAPATLAKYATIGGGPKFRHFGRWPRYLASELDEWIDARLSGPKKSTSDPGQRRPPKLEL